MQAAKYVVPAAPAIPVVPAAPDSFAHMAIGCLPPHEFRARLMMYCCIAFLAQVGVYCAVIGGVLQWYGGSGADYGTVLFYIAVGILAFFAVTAVGAAVCFAFCPVLPGTWASITVLAACMALLGLCVAGVVVGAVRGHLIILGVGLGYLLTVVAFVVIGVYKSVQDNRVLPLVTVVCV